MLQCEGYRIFRGVMRVTPTNPKFPAQDIRGVWLYKPEYNCWYANGSSYDADICEIVEDYTE